MPVSSVRASRLLRSSAGEREVVAEAVMRCGMRGVIQGVAEASAGGPLL